MIFVISDWMEGWVCNWKKKKIIPVKSISPVNPAAQDGTFKQSLKIPVTKSHFKGTFFVQAAFRLNVMLCSI